MADNNLGNRKGLMMIAGAALVLLAGLFLFGGGHNNGQPSAPSGEGNPMQTNQGR